MKFAGAAVVVFGMGLMGVNGQSSSATATSSAAGSSTTLPVSTALIPTNISSTCTTFLKTLNTDTTFSSCMAPLANLTALYNPVAGSDAPITAANITATLTGLCANSAGCSNGLIRSYLTNFYGACTPELSANTQIRELYDFLYVVNPLKGAVCSKDGSTQSYCVLQIAAAAKTGNSTTVTGGSNSTTLTNTTLTNSTLTNSTTFRSFASVATDLLAPAVQYAAANLVVLTPYTSTLTRRLVDYLSPRDSAQTVIVTPNTATYSSTGLAYLFLSPSLPASILCSSCSKSVLAAYIQWEASVPYALGLSTSPILGQQAALWSAVGKTCGTNWTDAVVASAGVLNVNGTMSAAVSSADSVLGSVGGAVVALALGAMGAMML